MEVRLWTRVGRGGERDRRVCDEREMQCKDAREESRRKKEIEVGRVCGWRTTSATKEIGS